MRRATIRLAVAAAAATPIGVLLPIPAMSSPAHACSCGQVSDAQALATADVAFVGRLVEIKRPPVMLSSAGESRFLFEVSTVFKGQAYETQSVVAASDGAACGLELQVGDEALVFGQAAGGEFDADLCNGTRALAQPLPSGFGEGTAPLLGSSPVGQDDSVASRAVRALPWLVAAMGMTLLGGVMLWRRRVRRQDVAA